MARILFHEPAGRLQSTYWSITGSLKLFRFNEHINAVLLRADENTRNILPFTVGSFLNNSFIEYIYQFYNFTLSNAQAAQTLFVIYIRDSIALRFKPFKRMYENGSKIALNLTCSKGFKWKKLTLVCACVSLKSLWQLSRSKVVLKPFWRFKPFQVCFPFKRNCFRFTLMESKPGKV